MATWSPIAGLPNPIIVDAAGTAGSGYVLKAYLPGTTTSTSIAIDSAGSSPQASITANADGIWEVSGNEILPYIDQKSKWGIFANATDAAANTPFYMGPFDNVDKFADTDSTSVVFATTAAMQLATLAVGQRATTNEFSTGSGGGADYLIVSGDSSDTYSKLLVAGGNTAVLQNNGELHTRQYGLIGDGVADDTGALNAIVADMTSTSLPLIFDEGTYNYSTSPNWAIQDSVVKFQGTVRLRNTGTGDCVIFDAGASSQFIYNLFWGYDNPPLIEGTSSTGDGVYIRSVHHSKIGGNVRGCGAAAFNIEFTVVNEYNFTTSINEGAFFSGATPTKGIVITRRGAAELASDNIFYNPIIEGVSEEGIYIDWGLMNHFISGTSEGNTLTNIECTLNARDNKFNGIDLEVPGNGKGIVDAGRRNTYNEVLNDSSTEITSTAIGCTLRGGIYDSITNAGRATVVEDLSYGSGAGEWSDTGTETTVREIYDLESASFKEDNYTRGMLDTTKEVVLGAFAAPSTVPGSVTKSVGTITGIEVGDVISIASQTLVSGDYILHAEVTASDTLVVSYTQITGAAASPLPAGATFTVKINGQ